MTVNGALPPVDAWQVISARITAFPLVAVSSLAQNWWEEFVGLPPDNVESRPKIGRHEVSGDFEGRQLLLQIQPERVDWAIRSVSKTPEDEPGVSLLGPFSEVVGSLLRVASRWVQQSPPINRLAFGVVLGQPVADRRTGYLLIKKYLPGVALDPDASDFLYQINRPRSSTSGIERLRINRLSKWSVQLSRLLKFTLVDRGIEAHNFQEESACRLELDINTAPDFNEALPADRIVIVLDELVELGREILEKGDVA